MAKQQYRCSVTGRYAKNEDGDCSLALFLLFVSVAALYCIYFYPVTTLLVSGLPLLLIVASQFSKSAEPTQVQERYPVRDQYPVSLESPSLPKFSRATIFQGNK